MNARGRFGRLRWAVKPASHPAEDIGHSVVDLVARLIKLRLEYGRFHKLLGKGAKGDTITYDDRGSAMLKGFAEHEKELIRKRLAAFCLGEVEIQLHQPISPPRIQNTGASYDLAD